MTTNNTPDPGTVPDEGEAAVPPAKPTRARRAAAPKAAKADGDAPAKAPAKRAPRKAAAARTADAADGGAAKAPAKRAPRKKPAAADTPVAGGAVDTPLAPDAPTPAEPVAATPDPDPAAAPDVTDDQYEKLIGGDTHDPHGILGAHPRGDGHTVVRTLRHHATSVTLLTRGAGNPDRARARRCVRRGDRPARSPTTGSGWTTAPDAVYEVDDPYRWLPTLGEIDLHLIGEGRHEYLWEVLGAHVRSYDTPGGNVTGTSFAVWAPNARGVRVTGDFDHWSGAGTPMRSLGSSGVWELFVPDVGAGTRYKFQILGQDGVWREKADPMAFASEVPPATASVVNVARHEWGDADWIARRAETDQLAAPDVDLRDPRRVLAGRA